jgi:putative ABC transport system permease protein
MTPVILRAFLRHLVRRRSLSLLQAAGIACGVAAALAMRLSSATALESLSRSVSFLGGRATHTLERPAGPMAEEVAAAVAADPAVAAVAPVIDRTLRLGDGRLVRLLGIDPFLDQFLRPEMARRFQAGGVSWETAAAFLLDPRGVMVEEGLARSVGRGKGGTLDTTRGDLHILDTFPSPTGEPLVLLDVAHAQTILELPGRLDRLELILHPTLEEGFRRRWSTGFVLSSGDQRRATLASLLDAFRLNLLALSLLSLFVGTFLIYNTALFSVVSRRREAGILLALGARRREIVAAFLAEALVLGTAGGAVGSWGGWLLGSGLTGVVGRTVSDLYGFSRPLPPPWDWSLLAQGTLLGLLATLAGVLLPLVELARVDPVQALDGGRRTGEQGGIRRSAGAGLAVVVSSLGVMALFPDLIPAGFAGAFGWLIGLSLLSGWGVVRLLPLIGVLLRGLAGPAGRLAGALVAERPGRSGVAVAAFGVALSLTIGLTAMIGSFRQTLVWWMDSQLRGDLYIGNVPEGTMPDDLLPQLEAVPGVDGVDTYRNVRLVFQGRPVYLDAVRAEVLGRHSRFAWVEGGRESWDQVARGAAIVSESFSRRFRVHRGDRITLEGSTGPEEVPVAGVFYDYTTEHGLITIDRATYLRLWGDRSVNTFAVFLREGTPLREEALAALTSLASARGYPLWDRRGFHASIMAVFDGTFAVTRSMRIIALLIAVFGIAGALLTFGLERRREMGVARALGFSRAQVTLVTVLEGVSLGLVSLALATAGGTGLAVILIRVINRASFNWTVFYHPSPEPYLAALAATVAAVAAASAYPAAKAWRSYPQMQIREE